MINLERFYIYLRQTTDKKNPKKVFWIFIFVSKHNFSFQIEDILYISVNLCYM